MAAWLLVDWHSILNWVNWLLDCLFARLIQLYSGQKLVLWLMSCKEGWLVASLVVFKVACLVVFKVVLLVDWIVY